MDRPVCLAQYPFVVVRIACGMCPHRQGSYRLARLAQRFGADTPLELNRSGFPGGSNF